jgi:cytidylate kinase
MGIANIIAIDGPAASGKSTVGQRLAEELGYLYFDTGVMYRALTWVVLQRQIAVEDPARISALAEQLDIDVRPPSQVDGRAYDVWVDGEDITWEIRSPAVDANVSLVSEYVGVRQALSAKQRTIGLRGKVVMVGRDIGTVVLPEADLKIYLEASIEERARRRHRELVARGENSSYENTLEAMRRRDNIDSTRAIAPLRPAADAIILDSDQLSIDQVLEKVRGMVPLDKPNPDMAEVYTVQRRARFFRWVMRPIFRGIFHILGPVKITGRENVPRRGAYLIAINHISLFEAPFIVAFWPVAVEAVGAADIWERPGQSTLVKYYGGIPLHRGVFDRHVMETLLKVLRSGRPLLISPEGARSHIPGMCRAEPGIAYLVEKADVPVVPVGIVGTTDDYLERGLHGKRPLLEMHIGKPFRLPPGVAEGAARREARQANADVVMNQIAALLPPEYQGVYADPNSLTPQTNE